MAENRFPCGALGGMKDTVCIDTNRVMDSCRDRDCFERVRVYLSDFGNEVLEHTSAIRAKSARIVSTNISIDPIQFNRGFYAVNIRFYIKLTFEACICGPKSQELEGIAVLEKRVILYGGESKSSIYKSNACDGFCTCPDPDCGEKNIPTAIVEVVDPVLLGTKILEKQSECNCCCCCQEHDMPKAVVHMFSAPLCFEEYDGNRYLTVSLGIFSVVRIVRPAQYLISATEHCIPEKECVPVEEDDPCKVFRSMPFPVGEFCDNGFHPTPSERPGRCGCNS